MLFHESLKDETSLHNNVDKEEFKNSKEVLVEFHKLYSDKSY